MHERALRLQTPAISMEISFAIGYLGLLFLQSKDDVY